MLKERETWATVDIATNTNSDGLATDSHCRSHPPMPNGEGKETSKVPDRDSTKPKGEKRAKIMAGHLLQCQHVNSETGLYIQRQLKKLCQLHALNALFGRNIVQPHSMLAFCEDEIQRDTALDRNLKNRGYCPHEGNFPDMVINTWLHYNSQPAVRLKCINDSIPRNSSEADFLGCLPGHIDAFVVRWDQGGLAHEDTGYGHAVCMRRHPEYQLYTSCKPDADDPRPGEHWAAGVAIAVHKSLTRQASVTHQLLNCAAASGHCQRVTLHPSTQREANHHNRIDHQVISDNLRTGRKATTVVLKNVTDDSDHYPILLDIPLEAMMFQRPGPEVPSMLDPSNCGIRTKGACRDGRLA